MSKNENYDISTNNQEYMKETELVEVNPKNLTGKDSGYTKISENEISTSSELLNINNNENNNINNKVDNHIFFEETINYRKGNMHTFFYDLNGHPKIVIGPDCKFCLLILFNKL
jgi:hypothetical protein